MPQKAALFVGGPAHGRVYVGHNIPVVYVPKLRKDVIATSTKDIAYANEGMETVSYERVKYNIAIQGPPVTLEILIRPEDHKDLDLLLYDALARQWVKRLEEE